jgi:hypothetical protein
MKRAFTIIGFLAAFPTTTAFADNRCFVPMTEWQPREAVQRLAQQNGWRVRRIKIDDGCYEIDGSTAEGRRIEVTVHPATLEIIKIEYEDDDNHSRRKRDAGDHD